MYPAAQRVTTVHKLGFFVHETLKITLANVSKGNLLEGYVEHVNG